MGAQRPEGDGTGQRGVVSLYLGEAAPQRLRAMGSMRCLVVDDDWFTRQGLTQCLRSVGGVDVAGEAASLAEALEHDGPLDVVLLDLGLPGTCRRTGPATLLPEWPNVRVPAITAPPTGPSVRPP